MQKNVESISFLSVDAKSSTPSGTSVTVSALGRGGGERRGLGRMGLGGGAQSRQKIFTTGRFKPSPRANRGGG